MQDDTSIVIGVLFTLFIIGDYCVSNWFALKDDVWLKIYPFSYSERIRAMRLGPIIVIGTFCIVIVYFSYFFNGSITVNPLLDLLGLWVWICLVVHMKAQYMLAKNKFS